MSKFDDLAKEILFESPLLLLTIKDKRIIDKINNYLPYSTGFEIECDKKESFKLENFQYIPDIMHIDIDNGEQRFRIPNGVRGIICLFNICQQLKNNSMLNNKSGIHYHIDMTDTFDRINESFIKENQNWILNELSTWRYKGTFNSKCIGTGFNWIRLQKEFKTAEIRIGEMTFDYQLLLKRIIHGNEIIRKVKKLLGGEKVEFIQPDSNKILTYSRFSKDAKYQRLVQLTNSLSELIDEEPEEKDNSNELIKNRTIKLF